MDAATKRRITIEVRRFLKDADLNVTTTRHVLHHLQQSGLADDREERGYARDAIRRAVAMTVPISVPVPYVRVNLYIENGLVAM